MMSKGSKRRPRATTREEQNLRDLYAYGLITFKQYEKKYKALKKRGLIRRNGRIVK